MKEYRICSWRMSDWSGQTYEPYIEPVRRNTKVPERASFSSATIPVLTKRGDDVILYWVEEVGPYG